MVSYDLGMLGYSRSAASARSLRLAASMSGNGLSRRFHTLEETLAYQQRAMDDAALVVFLRLTAAPCIRRNFRG
jgi:hypothetical protein